MRPYFAFENPTYTFTVSLSNACGIVDTMMHTLERYLQPILIVT